MPTKLYGLENYKVLSTTIAHWYEEYFWFIDKSENKEIVYNLNESWILVIKF